MKVSNYNFRISPNFTFAEVTHTSVKSSNVPDDIQILFNLFSSVQKLQELRDNVIKRPIHINSGYRSYSVNRAVGGVRNSDHCKGFAFDIVIDNMFPHQVFNALYDYSLVHKDLFGQVICYDTFVHVSFNTEKHHNEFIMKDLFNG